MNDVAKWVKYTPEIPDNGQVVFIHLIDDKIFVAQTIYAGKTETGGEYIIFYVYQQSMYVEDWRVKHYMPVILPQPPK